MRVILGALNYPGLGGIENSIENLQASFRSAGHSVSVASFAQPISEGSGGPDVIVQKGSNFKVRRLLLTGSIAAANAFRRTIDKTFDAEEKRSALVISRHPSVAYAFLKAGFERHIYLPPASMQQFYKGAISELKILNSPVNYLKHQLLRIVDTGLEHRLIASPKVTFVTFSKHLALYFEKLGKPTAVIEPGVDPRLIASLACLSNATVDEDTSELRLVYVGRLEPGKNIELLLSAIRRVTSTIRVTCTIVGSGSFYDRLRAAYPDEATYKFVGAQGKREIAALMRDSDFLVLPTYHEGFGQVLAEALVCGTPVIGYSSSVANTAIDQIINDASIGIRVDELGEEALARAIETAAQQKATFRASRRGIAVKARERFCWDRCVRELLVAA